MRDIQTQGEARRPFKILIVEDEWVTARDLQDTVAAMGYRVTGLAASADAAVAATTTEPPDLALVDIGLRGRVDGIELARQLRDRWDVPVVYLTAYRDRTTLDRARETHPAGYLAKPFDEAQLRMGLDIALRRTEEARRLQERADMASESAAQLEARLHALEGRLKGIAALVRDDDDEGRLPAELREKLEALTRREAEIVEMLVRGGRVSTVASALGLSINTVRNHLRSAFPKLDVHSQEELVERFRSR